MYKPTCAYHPCILMMATVMNSPSEAVATGQLVLHPTAVHIVQQDESLAITEVGISGVSDNRTTSDLPAHHRCIFQSPVIIAHSPPAAPVVDFHPALTAA